MARLVEKNLPYPETICSSSRQLSSLIREDKLGLKYPFILKEASAYGGKMNFLVKTPEEALDLLDEHKQGVFLAQEFLPNVHDFRIIVLGGKARLVLKRSQLDARKHVNNTSAGGEGLLISLDKVPAKLIALAEEAAAALGRSSYAGVDILERSDTGEYVVLEVNQTPQIEIGAEIDAKMSVMLARISEIAGGKHD
jgi:glutathione synthase/RimK-type ligase-like ATP-grasp enzyme